LSWKPSGGSVVAGEPPHAGNLRRPGFQGISQLHRFWQAGGFQLGDGTQQAVHQVAGLVFLQQQVAEALFETVDGFHGRMLGKISGQARPLCWVEIVAVAAHQAEQPAVLAGNGIDLAPAGQELLIDEAKDVKTVGDNAGLGEVPADQGTIGGGEVHADDTDVLLALQAL
jgi:hypothetical protein